ncbi:MAG: hypothetical protein EOO38_21630 [Cytophagaceae bacterium]|nr:MAG: hypothetical protein EOO38_21630 [Cytophagaceae bacterium]
MPTVFALYLSTDVEGTHWDLCGVYSSRALASDAITRLLNEHGGVIDDYAIDALVVDEDLE